MKETDCIYNTKDIHNVNQRDILDAMANVPGELKALKYWVCHIDKVPFNPTTGDFAKANDPTTWSTFETCLEAWLMGEYSGIGCELDTPYIVVDFDHCIDQFENTEPWVEELIDRLNSYTEYSPSTTGYHVWLKGIKPPGGCRIGGFEMYQTSRYMTVTGWSLSDASGEIEDRTDVIAEIHADKFPDRAAAPVESVIISPCESTCILSDAEIVQRASAALNGNNFRLLWAGLWQGAYKSQSEADLALCCHLAFWTRKDTSRMDSMFRLSGLYRKKWERADIRFRAISKAIRLTPEVYRESQRDRFHRVHAATFRLEDGGVK